MNLLEQLNDSQREAVQYNDGPELVIAGAGSGKTRVLTYKIAYLLEQGTLAPWNILALTFTNKAAREMTDRIGQLVGGDRARYLPMGTFHSIFSRILRAEAENIGYKPSFTIYDETDSRSLLKAVVKELGLDEKVYKPAAVHSRISMAKNHLISAAQYQFDNDAAQRDAHERMPAIGKIYLRYNARLQQANAMDFDDLLVNTYLLFQQHEDIRRKYVDRFRYVLVDEYQDTNYAQQQIVWLLTKERQMVCVVGDDYQSIYGFRGANIDNILGFQKLYDNAKLIKLEQNYRSTQHIVQAANSLMKHNSRQINKEVYSMNGEGDLIQLEQVYSDKEEAAVVCKSIKRIKREDACAYSDFVILYRTNAQSRAFEEEMMKQSIPYRIYGGLSFYQRKEIKDVLSYFRLVCNPDDEEAFKRIVNYPTRGIGDTTMQKVVAAAQATGKSLWNVIDNPIEGQLAVTRATLGKLRSFQLLISTFIKQSQEVDAYTLGQHIIKESGISADLYSSRDPEAIARQENLDELLNSLQEFVAGKQEEGEEQHVYLADFLQEVALMTDLDSADTETEKVSLMTIHSAKGLEFPTVFVVGLEEGIFPSPMSSNSIRELEEERRLLYVAITRAEKHCFLSWAKNRWRYGKSEFHNPSRFINDIDPALLSVHDESKGLGIMPWDNDNRRTRRSWSDGDGSEWSGGSGRGTRQTDYEINTPYTGTRSWNDGSRSYSSRMQNSRPVANQFMADPKPKITAPRRAEQAIDPLSPQFKARIAAHGGNLRRVSDAIANGGRAMPSSATASSQTASGLAEGDIIAHQRFGIGTVVRLEGTGENMKATVEFRNTGTKQLLLKFARFTIEKKANS